MSKVSIIIVTYNHKDFVEEALDSCLQQRADYPNLEIIVADDGSTDGTAEIIRDYAGREPGVVIPVLSPVNGGIAKNFNNGLRTASGEYIAWLGGDDIMLPGKIARQVEFMLQHPDASGSYHDAEVFSWPNNVVLGLFSVLYAGKASRVDYLNAVRMLDPGYQMLPSTLMLRKSKIPSAFDTRLKFHNDYLFDVEAIVLGGPYWRMDGVWARYRKHDRSIGKDATVQKIVLEENLIVMAIIEARYPHLARLVSRRVRYYLCLDLLKAHALGDKGRSNAIRGALYARGHWFVASLMTFAGFVALPLVNPKNRQLVIRFRNLF